MRIRRTFGTIAVALAFSSLTYGQRPAPPQTPQRPVTDEYFGIKVVDPYRWLENWDDPEVRAWTDAGPARRAAVRRDGASTGTGRRVVGQSALECAHLAARGVVRGEVSAAPRSTARRRDAADRGSGGRARDCRSEPAR